MPNPDRNVAALGTSFVRRSPGLAEILAAAFSTSYPAVRKRGWGWRGRSPAPSPSAALVAAIADGDRLDLGHGINLSFAIARRLMAQGLLPYTISSDVHGDFAPPHHDETLDYSLCGALSKLVALGMELSVAIAAVTLHPAQVLQAEAELGTLQVGTRADITVLENTEAPWVCRDAQG